MQNTGNSHCHWSGDHTGRNWPAAKCSRRPSRLQTGEVVLGHLGTNRGPMIRPSSRQLRCFLMVAFPALLPGRRWRMGRWHPGCVHLRPVQVRSKSGVGDVEGTSREERGDCNVAGGLFTFSTLSCVSAIFEEEISLSVRFSISWIELVNAPTLDAFKRLMELAWSFQFYVPLTCFVKITDFGCQFWRKWGKWWTSTTGKCIHWFRRSNGRRNFQWGNFFKTYCATAQLVIFEAWIIPSKVVSMTSYLFRFMGNTGKEEW